MRKLVLERDCPVQQIFPSEEGAIFRGALKWRDFLYSNHNVYLASFCYVY